MEASVLRRLDRLTWATVALVAAIVLAATAVSDFRIEWRTFAAPALVCAVLAGTGWFYRRWRSDLRLASGLNSTAQVIAFAAVGAPLSYLAASANLPLQDHAFDIIDRALGLDWRGLLGWMNSQSALHPLFVLPYLSFTMQASITVLALAFSNRLLHLRTFTLAFMLSAIVCIAISAILPAEGTWGFYQLTPADYPAIVPATREIHLPIFHGLRDGSLRLLTGMTSEGIITFPSFHAALGVIFIVGLWPVPVLRWIGAVVNGLMILATPVDGGHYFIDVFAGIAIAVLCLVAARRIVHSTARYAPATAVMAPHLVAGE
jgi:membrane-associated phospholipid phosphatase